MIELDSFREWLKNNTDYSDSVISDVVSRMKRADAIHAWDGNEAYLFYLGENADFKALSTSVRSQLRKATRLYSDFSKSIAE